MKKDEPLPQVEGYEPVKKTISILRANIYAIVLFILALLIGIIVEKFLWNDFSYRPLEDGLLFILGVVAGLVIHELVHGVTWLLLLKKGFSHLSFGLMKGAVYCHIDVPMDKKKYVKGALMPLVLVGLLPWLMGMAIGSFLWILIGSVMISGAMGDIMIVWILRKEPPSALVYDHPSEAGCYVYHKVE